MKYYTDNELLERVRDVGNSKDSYEWLAGKIGERFAQKDQRIEHLQQRVNAAAEYMGHQLITDLVEEGY
jgi:disulfide oxidoreductase YuzD